MRWVSGEGWGFRSIDGFAEPDSSENRANILRFAGPVIVGISATAFIVTLILRFGGEHLDGFHPVEAMVGASVVLGMSVLAVPFIRRAPAMLILATVVAAEVIGFPIIALTLGHEFAVFVAIGYIVLVGGCIVSFTQRAAFVPVLAAGVGWGVTVTVQPGNSLPVARWITVMGSVVIVSVAVASLVERTRVVAIAEGKARAAAVAAEAVTAELSRTLERRVGEQVAELDRLGRLRRFLSTPIADVVLSEDSTILAPHRREIAVFVCDLRGFTAFNATAEPEEVLGVVGEYFDVIGDLIQRHEATVANFTGDGLMAFFNDPIPCTEPAHRAIKMAVELRSELQVQISRWNRRGYDLELASAIAFGYASLGMIGFEGRRDYNAFGVAVNLASRLCSIAEPGQILIDQRAYSAIPEGVAMTTHETYTLKGFHEPVKAYNVTQFNWTP